MSKALGRVDEALEGAGVLPKLEAPPALSKEAQEEFDEVSGRGRGVFRVTPHIQVIPVGVRARSRRSLMR